MTGKRATDFGKGEFRPQAGPEEKFPWGTEGFETRAKAHRGLRCFRFLKNA